MSEQTDRKTLENIQNENVENLIPMSENAAQGMAMSADSVATEMNKLVDEGQISIGDKALVLWFFGICKARGLTIIDAGKLIHYTPATISRLFRGNYEGSISNIIKAIRAYKQLLDERGKMTRDEFVDTSIWREIRDTCNLAILRHAPVRIVGVSQIGKTSALLEFQRRSEYLTRYCRLPAAPTFRGVISAVAQSCAVTTGCSTEKLRSRVCKALDQQTLLVVDELHQLAISAGKGVAMKVMEWLRELYDVSGCGLAVCGTRTMEDDLIGGELRGWLDQFDQRCIRVLNLPSRLPDSDILACAEAYQMPRPKEETMEFLRPLRMNRLVVTLNFAADLAQRKESARSWEFFMQAYKTVFGEIR